MWLYVDPGYVKTIVRVEDAAGNVQRYVLSNGVDQVVSMSGVSGLDVNASAGLPAPVGMSHTLFSWPLFETALGWIMALFVVSFGVGTVWRLLND